MESLTETLRPLVQSLFAVDSIWSVVLRGAIWFGIAMVIIVSTDVANPDKSLKSLKSNLGFFLVFLILSGVLVYTLFGFTSTGPTTG
jgi:hypothetical protein